MPANLENSAVAPELEKVSFHFNPKEGKGGELEANIVVSLRTHRLTGHRRGRVAGTGS